MLKYYTFSTMEIPRHWRLNKQRYLLVGDKDKYGNVAYPPGPNRPRFNPNTGESANNHYAFRTEIENTVVVFQSTKV